MIFLSTELTKLIIFIESKMKRQPTLMVVHFVIISILLSFSCSATQKIRSQSLPVDKETLFQVSTMQALLAGNFEGDKTVFELKKKGDFGIGVFNALNGELIALDGRIYQAKENGVAAPASDKMMTPFAVMTFFEADEILSIEEESSSFPDLRKLLDTLITEKSAFYAIRIEGEFENMKIRSVPAQIKPYRKLLATIKRDQKVFDLKSARGTMVGFWFPVYTGGLNIPRYHFHFISRSRRTGGHVLDGNLLKGTIEVDLTPNIQVEMITRDEDRD